MARLDPEEIRRRAKLFVDGFLEDGTPESRREDLKKLIKELEASKSEHKEEFLKLAREALKGL